MNRIKRTFGKKIVIGYGSYNRKSQMKWSMPTPNIGMKRLLSKKFRVYTVDEYRTSKTCYYCKGDTCYYRKRENPKPFREGEINVHGLLMCKTCSKSGKSFLTNRDSNGSLNILRIMKDWIYKRKREKVFCHFHTDYVLSDITKVLADQ